VSEENGLAFDILWLKHHHDRPCRIVHYLNALRVNIVSELTQPRIFIQQVFLELLMSITEGSFHTLLLRISWKDILVDLGS
jgi:hypothetical protein